VASESSVSLADIEAAAERLRGVVRDLPVHSARWLSDLVGGPAFLATENLQRAGSFKIRGAYNRLSQLTDAERAVGVVAASAGNHAQGVALAAGMLGIHATIFMPRSASMPKVIATQDYGAEVRFHGATLDEAIAEARQFAEQTGALFISPFDHADIVAGQGTLGLEIIEQIADLDAVVVAIGGGGLMAGLSTAVKAVKPGIRVIGVEPEGSPTLAASLAAKRRVRLDAVTSRVATMSCRETDERIFQTVRQNADYILLVPDDAMLEASRWLWKEFAIAADLSGAASIAALQCWPGHFAGLGKVCALVCGAGTDGIEA